MEKNTNTVTAATDRAVFAASAASPPKCADRFRAEVARKRVECEGQGFRTI